jgi:superfamily II DNA or RNA helicase
MKKFNERVINEIGGCNSLNLGVNLIETRYGILESYVGSSINTRQRFGRLDRLSPNDIAVAFIVVTVNTQMEKWLKEATRDIDLSEAIEIYNLDELDNYEF